MNMLIVITSEVRAHAMIGQLKSYIVMNPIRLLPVGLAGPCPGETSTNMAQITMTTAVATNPKTAGRDDLASFSKEKPQNVTMKRGSATTRAGASKSP